MVHRTQWFGIRLAQSSKSQTMKMVFLLLLPLFYYEKRLKFRKYNCTVLTMNCALWSLEGINSIFLVCFPNYIKFVKWKVNRYSTTEMCERSIWFCVEYNEYWQWAERCTDDRTLNASFRQRGTLFCVPPRIIWTFFWPRVSLLSGYSTNSLF